ncbi:uncharacterized protein B0H18DRAFT_1126714 [Fomitopsis serialis]|uniref:uncharacterized protein n=1 Tax=Fomitopsis serialis TaxID=139415 RepID=UPI002007E6C1|nr:uncharacterized protein B0H18DRAFT_1126714 [Neoantrodia serialis]KAH9912897.1 hypothetical protein B0H18DRAFT_1126714 [Neoantrodia serialis]
MRYSTLASAVLLAAAAAPALAHPVTIRATEDASIVERELQDELVERGYYDDLVSRDLQARKDSARGPTHLAGMIKKDAANLHRQRPDVNSPSGSARHAYSGSHPSHSHPNRVRSDDEIVERALPGRKGPVRQTGPPPLHPGPDPRPRPRSDYYDIVARDLEARRQPPRPPRPVTPPLPRPGLGRPLVPLLLTTRDPGATMSGLPGSTTSTASCSSAVLR